MKNTNFGNEYADIYDLLYEKKPYSRECDVIESMFHRAGNGRKVHSILDLGCGTGGHLFEMTNRGYSCVGVDISKSMIEIAINKELANGLSGSTMFHHDDIRTFRLDREFDAVIMMFAVLGYQTSNRDVLMALQTVRHHLKSGGVFVFDVWFGPAVLVQRPSERVKVIESNGVQVIRTVGSTVDVLRQTCDVNYKIWKIEGDRVLASATETHRMRYFFAAELELLFEISGLSVKGLYNMEDSRMPPDEQSWNIIGEATTL